MLTAPSFSDKKGESSAKANDRVATRGDISSGGDSEHQLDKKQRLETQNAGRRRFGEQEEAKKIDR